jgi:hypothetical protein
MARRNEQQPRVEVKPIEEGAIELRYFTDPHGRSYRAWNMSVKQACDLATWWNSEGSRFRDGQDPIRARQTGCILISMFSATFVQVRMLNEYGKPTQAGCSLPREVIEQLVARMNGGSANASKIRATM